MLAFSDPNKWWESTFSEFDIANDNLPDPYLMPKFWKKIFPIFSLLSDNIKNTNQYWKRIQRIMGQISTQDEIPCPFQRRKQFISSFYQFIKELNPKSIPQIFSLLECLPKTYDSQTVLWSIPTSIEDPELFLILLNSLYTSNHWIWNSLLNSDGGCDLIFDRFLPYLIPSENLPNSLKKYQIIIIDIIFNTLQSHPHFLESFESVFPNVLLVLKKGDFEQSIHCFRLMVYLFKSQSFAFSNEKFENFIKEFCENSIQNPILKNLVGNYILSLKIPNISIVYLSKIYLDNNPDHNSILFIEKNLINTNENIDSIIIQILTFSVTDKIFCSSYLHLLQSIKSLLSVPNQQISSFIQKIVGFVIVAKTNNSKKRTVSIIFELLKTLNNLGQDWIRNEVSKGAAILLASQKVPLALVNSLKPSIHCDKFELAKWEKFSSETKLNIKEFLSDNSMHSGQKLKGSSNNEISKSKTCVSVPHIAPKPPLAGVRSAPTRNARSMPKGNISSISKGKAREVKKPFVRTQTKFFQNYRDSQS